VEFSIELVDAKLIPLVACLTLCLYTPLKQQFFKDQVLLKQQALLDQEGLRNLHFAFAAAAILVLSNLHMPSHLQFKTRLQLLRLHCNTSGPLCKYPSAIPIC